VVPHGAPPAEKDPRPSVGIAREAGVRWRTANLDRWMSQKPGTQTGPYKKDSEWMWIHPSHMVNS